MRYYIIIWTLLLIGCDGTEIEFPDKKEILVIEGWITNQEKAHWIKVSRTAGFTEPQQEIIVTDADVAIEDNFGNQYPLSPGSDDRYYSNPFRGQANRSYRVVLRLSNGDSAFSRFDHLNSVSEIKAIGYDFFVRANPESGEDEDVYYPIVSSADPANEVNFYRYKGYRNGEFLDEPQALELLSDRFINGQDSLPHNISRFEYALGDQIKVELHSLTENAFRFLELLKSQTTSLGSSSGTSPAPLRGNLYYKNSDQIILGYFGASAVTADSVVIE